MTPTIGRIVHVFPGENTQWHFNGNGANDPIAAIITRVWNNDSINVIAFPDASTPLPLTSVNRKKTHPSMRWDWPEIVQNVVPTSDYR